VQLAQHAALFTLMERAISGLWELHRAVAVSIMHRLFLGTFVMLVAIALDIDRT
jgi:hypothetical protein